MKTFAAYAAILRELGDLGSGQAAILHRLDELLRCQDVIATKVAHLHDANARRSMRPGRNTKARKTPRF